MVSIFGLASSSTTNWFADSGATQHMSDQRHLFTNFTSITPGKLTITGIGKKVIYAHGRGDIPIKTKINGQLISGTIKDVLFLPDIGINLISIPVITELGYKVTFSGSDVEIVHGESLFMVGRRVGQSLYQLDLLTQEKVNAKAAISSGASFDVWHERLAHVNHDTIRKMITSNSVVGLNIIGELSAAPCDPCIIEKMHRMPFPKGRERAEEVGGIIHSDVVEMNVPSSMGKRFYCIFKDGFSRFKAAYTMKHKSETPDCFKAFAERMYTDTRKRPRIFRSDGGGEFKSNSFVNWLSSQGILHQTSAAHTPQQNGVAERDNRTTVEAVRTALHAKQIPLHL
jgi:hypothetical protein